jgi:hypothetical protein
LANHETNLGVKMFVGCEKDANKGHVNFHQSLRWPNMEEVFAGAETGEFLALKYNTFIAISFM